MARQRWLKVGHRRNVLQVLLLNAVIRTVATAAMAPKDQREIKIGAIKEDATETEL